MYIYNKLYNDVLRLPDVQCLCICLASIQSQNRVCILNKTELLVFVIHFISYLTFPQDIHNIYRLHITEAGHKMSV